MEHLPISSEHDSPTIPPIHRLPTEIICHIASLLTPLDAAYLTLTSRQMLYHLGDQHFKTLKRSHDKPASLREQHLHFLDYFDHRYPDHFLCSYCHVYHPRQPTKELHIRSEAKAYNLFFNNEPSCPRFIDFHDRHFYRKFTWSRPLYWESARLVLRAAQYGAQFGLDVANLDCDFRHQPLPNKHCIQTRTAKIIRGRLVLKLQAHYLGPPWLVAVKASVLALLKSFTPMAPALWDTGLCHYIINDLMRERIDALRTIVKADKNAHCFGIPNATIRHTSIYRCDCCPSDVLLTATTIRNLPDIAREALQDMQVAALQEEEQALRVARFAQPGFDCPVLVMTRWVDYGCGGAVPSPEYKALHLGDFLGVKSRKVEDIAVYYEHAGDLMAENDASLSV